jgi:hypothetical protein
MKAQQCLLSSLIWQPLLILPKHEPDAGTGDDEAALGREGVENVIPKFLLSFG